jgi:hypothetical protein
LNPERSNILNVQKYWTLKKGLAPSGKSPAYIHRRNNRARAGKPVAGFFNRTAAAFHGAPPFDVAHCASIELPSEPISRRARTRRQAAWFRSTRPRPRKG